MPNLAAGFPHLFWRKSNRINGVGQFCADPGPNWTGVSAGLQDGEEGQGSGIGQFDPRWTLRAWKSGRST